MILKGAGLGVMPSTIVARRLFGWGATSRGVAGDCRTRGPLGMGLRVISWAGAEVDSAERLGVDFELAEDTDRLVGVGLAVLLLAANFDLILSLSPA